MRVTIVSDRITEELNGVDIKSDIDADIQFQQWSEFDPNSIIADHLIIDLNLIGYTDNKSLEDIPISSHLGGKVRRREEIQAPELEKKFDVLQSSDNIPKFLQSGGRLTVLYSDEFKINSNGRLNSHYWLTRFRILSRTVPVEDAEFTDKGVSGFEIQSDSDPVEVYFGYVEGYTNYLDFENMADEDPEILARSKDGFPIASISNKFSDPNASRTEHDGQIILLPQPTDLYPNPQKLLRSIIQIGGQVDSRVPTTSGSPQDDFQSSLPTIVTQNIQNELNSSKYGEEVMQHIEDGDACIENGLWQPALSSYIHAMEWAFITYLEHSQNIDIIQIEQSQGTYYSFARGRNDLLSEVQNYTSISQKTETAIKGLNQGQRRWIAHHKSGQTLKADATSVRARLGVVLDELFA